MSYQYIKHPFSSPTSCADISSNRYSPAVSTLQMNESIHDLPHGRQIISMIGCGAIRKDMVLML